MQRILSFERSPPFSVPLRFFLTAPFFAVVAGILVLWYGPAALESRWSPVTLGLTHLLTLGVVTMSMVGALLQLLHVVAGIEVPHVRLAAGLVHTLLVLGVATFVAAFLSAIPAMFQIALVLLLVAFVWLLGTCLYGFLGAEGGSATLSAMRLSLLALAVTVALGGTLAAVFAWGIWLPFELLGNLHVAWGLLGWVGILVAGVAYQVVPMFQVTPTYPPLVTKWLAPILFLLLSLWSVATAILPATFNWVSAFLSILLAGGYAIFSATTLYLLWRRKRKTRDVTSLFWLASLVSLLGGAGLWLLGETVPQVKSAPCFSIALGILFLPGFAFSAINGMLYKIVPFLVWYHLQNSLAGLGKKAPNVRQIIADRMAGRQFFAHLAALILLAGAAVWPDWMARPAGAAFAISSIFLGFNMLSATRIYLAGLK